jgi:unsaturated chondroitin disaccharide hydrolase
MKNILWLCLFIVTILLNSSCKKESAILTPEMKDFFTTQYKNTLSVSNDLTRIPRTIAADGSLVSTDIYDWTSGFFAGNLWYLYELTADEFWKNEAVKWTETLDTIQYYTGNHDVGFMINCSYGNGLRITGNEAYRKVIIQAAGSLCTRYNPVTKCIKSWNYQKAWNDTTDWHFPVIVDNMMNLELLFEATRLSGDKKFEDIAIQHAQTTMKNHYRPDFSSYHVVNYDTITGGILDKATYQGFVDESSWSRGQSWGLYGFIVCYRYTKDPQYLAFAENIANYLISHPDLPEDMIPYWDYSALDTSLIPEWKHDDLKFPVTLRDASAAAIMCSALFELGKFSTTQGARFTKSATKILRSLASPAYMESPNDKYFILNHCVGSLPHRAEVDKPLVYADYYFLEALLRYSRL